jgi:hypothetical protein
VAAFVVSARVRTALSFETNLLDPHQAVVLVSLHLVLHDAQHLKKLETFLELGLLSLVVIVPGVCFEVLEVASELSREDFPQVLGRSLLLLDDDILF